MREVKVLVKLYDDLDLALDGTKTVAEHTVTVGLNGVWRELDLSEARHAELAERIAKS